MKKEDLVPHQQAQPPSVSTLNMIDRNVVHYMAGYTCSFPIAEEIQKYVCNVTAEAFLVTADTGYMCFPHFVHFFTKTKFMKCGPDFSSNGQREACIYCLDQCMTVQNHTISPLDHGCCRDENILLNMKLTPLCLDHCLSFESSSTTC